MAHNKTRVIFLLEIGAKPFSHYKCIKIIYFVELFHALTSYIPLKKKKNTSYICSYGWLNLKDDVFAHFLFYLIIVETIKLYCKTN